VRVVPIERAGDPRVVDYRDLREADLRDASGLFIVEGRLNVKRLLGGSRFTARSVFVTPAALAALEPTLERSAGCPAIFVAEPSVLKEVVGYDLHRGCLAAAERGVVESLDQALASAAGADGSRLWIALERVGNPENVGGIFRNALAFCADRLLLTPHCADPLYRKTVRVSMGAALRVPFARAPEGAAAMHRLRDAGFCIVALSAARDATPLPDFAPASDRLVLWLGSEGDGLAEATLRDADHRLTIPMAPGIDSLNAATASGIALHHLARQLGRLGAPA
jgi:tRNA G18 (ribose-2'-O)-methylase SpoU